MRALSTTLPTNTPDPHLTTLNPPSINDKSPPRQLPRTAKHPRKRARTLMPKHQTLLFTTTKSTQHTQPSPTMRTQRKGTENLTTEASRAARTEEEKER